MKHLWAWLLTAAILIGTGACTSTRGTGPSGAVGPPSGTYGEAETPAPAASPAAEPYERERVRLHTPCYGVYAPSGGSPCR
jgi:hypothetical protein